MKPILLFLLLLTFVGCSAFQPRTSADPGAVEAPLYRLMAGDVIELKITQRQDMNGEYTLGPDGSVFFPEIGRIQLSGLSHAEAETTILTALKKLYSPISLNLMIKTYQGSEYVVILGEVEMPGMYPIINQLSLVQLVGNAQGFTRDADLSRITLVREQANAAPLKINLNKLIQRGDLGQNLTLQNGDLIVVPRKHLRVGLHAMSELLPFAQLAILVLVTFSRVN